MFSESVDLKTTTITPFGEPTESGRMYIIFCCINYSRLFCSAVHTSTLFTGSFNPCESFNTIFGQVNNEILFM